MIFVNDTTNDPLFNVLSFDAVNTDFASLFAGNVINLFLYGVLTVQLYLYYISFPQDPWLLKTIVHLIYLTETGHSILLIYDIGSKLTSLSVGETTIVSFMLSGVGSETEISLAVIPVCGGIVAFLTKGTYIYRIRILSQLRYISWIIVALIAGNFVVFIVLESFGAAAYVTVNIHTTLNGYVAVFPVWASVSLVIDAAIAGIMIWSLTKNKILSKQLKSKVIRLVYLIIGTGALTAVIKLVTVILFAVGSDTAWGPAVVLSKLYANSMMVFLNDRIPSGHGHDDHTTSEAVTGALDSMRFARLSGRADTAQEQLALEDCNDARGSMPEQMAVPSNKHSCPA